MKRKITAAALILISVLSIALILVKTPILDAENYEDEKSRYLDYYILAYKTTKSRDVLSHIIMNYSNRGDNYGKLKPLYDDVFAVRDEYRQNTIEVNAFTYTDSFYVKFLLSNGKTQEADKYCDECFSKGEYAKLHQTLHSIGYFSENSEIKNFAFEKLKELVHSEMYQSSIAKKFDRFDNLEYSVLEGGKLSAWAEYVDLLFQKGEFESAVKEVEKMAENKGNGYRLIFNTLILTEESDNEKKSEFTEKAINILSSSGCASDEEMQRIKESFKIEQ